MNNMNYIPFDPNAPARDKCGQEIKAGCFVIYGHALGRCAALKFGKILKITLKGSRYPHRPDIPEHHFSVIGVDEDNWKNPITYSLSKKGTLQFSDRMVVIPKSMLPQEVKVLLDQVNI